MNQEFLKARSTQYAAYAAVYIVVVVAILGAVNFLAQRYDKTFDTTANKKYSLSDQTDKIVKGLKTPVTVTYYDKSDNFRAGHDLLDRYANLSPKLTVNYIDPDKKPMLAKAAGLRNYGSIVIEGNNKREDAKALTEEEVTSGLVRLLKGGERTLCYENGSGEHAMDSTDRSGYAGLKQLIEHDSYKTQAISLLDKPEVPKACTVVLVGGPRLDYIPPVVTALQQYVQSGGRVLFMLSPPLHLGHEEIGDNTGLVAMLAGLGVTVDKDLVLDTSIAGQLVGANEITPVATAYEQHPITRTMSGVTAFPYSRSLTIKDTDKTKVSKLFSSSPNSFATDNLSSETIKIDQAKDKAGPFTLAAAGTYDTGKKDGEGRFVVVGSADWTDNSILPAGSIANRDLFLNMINWLSSDEDLISIRPKEPDNRPLVMTQRGLSTIFLISMVMLPLMAIMGGVGVWLRRR